MRLIPADLTSISHTVSAGLRLLAAAACVTACASLAGCASNQHMAADWASVGNNGGKVDRFAIARAAARENAAYNAAEPNTAR